MEGGSVVTSSQTYTCTCGERSLPLLTAKAIASSFVLKLRFTLERTSALRER